jgi:hypothetical protein
MRSEPRDEVPPPTLGPWEDGAQAPARTRRPPFGLATSPAGGRVIPIGAPPLERLTVSRALPDPHIPLDPALWPVQLGRMCAACPYRREAPPSGPSVQDIPASDPEAPRPFLWEGGQIWLSRYFRVLGTPWALHLGLPARNIHDPEAFLSVELMGRGVDPTSSGVLAGTSLADAHVSFDDGALPDGCDDILCRWQDTQEDLPWQMAHAYVQSQLPTWLQEVAPERLQQLPTRLADE